MPVRLDMPDPRLARCSRSADARMSRSEPIAPVHYYAAGPVRPSGSGMPPRASMFSMPIVLRSSCLLLCRWTCPAVGEGDTPKPPVSSGGCRTLRERDAPPNPPSKGGQGYRTHLARNWRSISMTCIHIRIEPAAPLQAASMALDLHSPEYSFVSKRQPICRP